MLALNKVEIRSKIVLETLVYLKVLASKFKKLMISWVKAHVNTTGNEMADQAAKEGTMQTR